MDVWELVGAVGSVTAAGVAAWAAHQSRSSAQEANAAAKTMAAIEHDRRHSELCPRFRLSCEPGPPGSVVLRLHVRLLGPPGLDRLDGLTVAVRDDHFGRDEGPLLTQLTKDQVRQQVWGPYRITPLTGSHGALADATGRTLAYKGHLPLGEELLLQLENTPPPPWSQMTPQDWRREQGTVIRLALEAEHTGHGAWTVPCEIDVADGTALVVVQAPSL